MALDNYIPTGDVNRVRISGSPNETGEGLADGAVTPGAVLIKGTADGDLKESTAATRLMVGYALENDWGDSEDFFADFADNARLPYAFGVGDLFMGMIKPGSAALVHGDLLQAGSNGHLEKYSIDTTTTATVAGDVGKDCARFMGVGYTPHATNVERKLIKWLG